MSGLSLTEMRRIGAERNQGSAPDDAGKANLLAKLPSVFARKEQSAEAVPNLNRGQTTASHEDQPAPYSDVAAMPAQKPGAPSGTLPRAQATRPLGQNVLRHTGVGGAVGGAVALAATGSPVALPAGAVVGALAGSVVAKRSQRIADDSAPKVELKPKQAAKLFEAVRSACGLVECREGRCHILIDQSAGMHAAALGGSRRSAPKGYKVTIGYAVLAGLANRQIEALAAHALVCAKLAHEAGSVDTETLHRLAALNTSLSKRPPLARLSKMDVVTGTQVQATDAFHQAWQANACEADVLAARYAGPRTLVDALLAQALLAARFWQDRLSGQTYMQSLQRLEAGYGRAQLDGALHFVAQHTQPDADAARFGMPTLLLERVATLDTSCSVPSLPALDSALDSLDDRAKKALTKKLVKAAKMAGADAAGVGGKTENVRPSKPQKRKAAKKKAGSKSLFGGLFAGRAQPETLADLDPHLEPLYEADALYKNDSSLGLEAYQTLVHAHPRWALARLRLAEAQIEMGLPDCVTNLMVCAERLPSALPTILDRLQSALAMVSPLEEEPLRQAIATMQTNAAAIARERAEIDLESLTDCSLDTQDRETLSSLFRHATGLREVWVLGAPCTYMAEVPHHAILGLAPRLSPDDAQAMAMTLAEHAAITGTVAVHIETGTPQGALGDALAGHSSLWRAGNR